MVTSLLGCGLGLQAPMVAVETKIRLLWWSPLSGKHRHDLDGFRRHWSPNMKPSNLIGIFGGSTDQLDCGGYEHCGGPTKVLQKGFGSMDLRDVDWK